ncbi:MAG: response regulator [Caulobacteraceae bacterium]|nr:response regulator [Caulobacteraceae bacterium]
MTKDTESATGVPAAGGLETPNETLMGRTGMRHWKQSVISHDGLDERSGVFFAALEMTRMPMILTNPRLEDNPIVFANNAFLDLTGYEVEEIAGRNCRFLQGAETDPAAVSELRRAVAAREAIALEILNYRRDGSAFWNAVFIGPVYGQDDELLYFFASQLDVTARREALQQTLQSQKMEAIGQLTAGLAHDFNNILQIIDGSLERIDSRRGDPVAMDRFLGAARTATSRGAALTKQLLAFARRSRLEPRATDVSLLVNSVAELLDSTIGAGCTLQFHLQRRLPPVKVDPILLETALLNLIINARDAMGGEGDITLSVKLARLEDDSVAPRLANGDYLSIEVSDNGPGMPPHVKTRAAEPFFTTKPPGQGTGLGLAMAHGFASQSGGRLEIESEEGEGATIRILLPAIADREEAPSTQSDFNPRPVDLTAPPRILIVEDEPEIAAMAKDILEELGYRTAVAHNADKALEIFKASQEAGAFDLVFSDVVMPGPVNGVALAQEIHRLSPATPILMTTGYNDQMALEGPQAEAMDVLGKPYKPKELIDRVQAALRNGARTGPGRERSDFGHAQS